MYFALLGEWNPVEMVPSLLDHPVILFNDLSVMKVDEHKHLGIILDSKLSFSAHIHAVITRSRKGIGMLKFLSKYLPRNTLKRFV